MRTWKFRDLIRLLEKQGFELDRQSGNSRIYKGIVGGKVRLVSVHYHRGSDDIKPGTLNSMIRQSGLPKKLFR
ncbi:MAG: type II toxin-antitoxin system HicA family toxin [Proteobacteria bacterium]|nr:type II toxin-antitoxin system HicA family toxin [Pseudomonadota bacterium]